MDHQSLAAAMVEATRLTRERRLAEATALIQRGLLGLPVDGESGSVRADSPRPDRGRWPVTRALLGRRDGSSWPSTARTTTPSRPSPRILQGLSGFASRLPGLAPMAPAGPELPGETLLRSYRGPEGERPYLLYVPSGWTGEPVPLVVMLHGGMQGAAEFAAATRMNELAEEHTFLVAWPEQVPSANPGRYWNWFQPEDQRRGSGEASLIAGITARVLAEYSADPDRVYVAGFSAGAAMAAVMGASHSDVYAAVGVHSGLPHGAAEDVASAFEAMRQGPRRTRPLARAVPVITFHGDADSVVSPVNAVKVIEQFAPAGGASTVVTSTGRAPGGRTYSRTQVQRGRRGVAEQWTVHGSGHAWSGGTAGGTYADPAGPDASAEMVRFFAEHPAAD
ncbi:MAG TPA: PHB depolymerase family esterase [Pseudonocardia sp.]|uniref:extracellular catalytic domain type 1 short-chain-length polyhydroxyalkanoate depolymerase n=1 Tax=Pseudonocardia sp. TaxID=60912 RepID=UPI002B686834|nr:PHB depolymerase family esterase [Pseudonocardia sp.]HTF55276.1 PHB depolymerase family esterase [Pseudonocardia sp.]